MPEDFATTQDRSNQACQRLHCVEIELYSVRSVVTDSFLCVNTGFDTNNRYFFDSNTGRRVDIYIVPTFGMCNGTSHGIFAKCI